MIKSYNNLHVYYKMDSVPMVDVLCEKDGGKVTLTLKQFQMLADFAPPIRHMLDDSTSNTEQITEFRIDSMVEIFSFAFDFCYLHRDDINKYYTDSEKGDIQTSFRNDQKFQDVRDVDFLAKRFPRGITSANVPFLLEVQLLCNAYDIQFPYLLVSKCIAKLLYDIAKSKPITKEGCAQCEEEVRTMLNLPNDCTAEQRAEAEEIVAWCVENDYGKNAEHPQ